ncbi:restriction endonuclease [Kitasatospora sp. NPDC091335]|uniref:restriction endonuclease n=1 Tax=Kitasatospora sp. NPDC091335 TaxID=3364085 RepID=UPI00381C68BB
MVGATWTSGRHIIEWVTELIGARAGLAISEEDVAYSLKRTGYGDWYPGTSNEITRVRSETLTIIAYSAMDAFYIPGAFRGIGGLVPELRKILGDNDLASRAAAFVVQMTREREAPDSPISLWDVEVHMGHRFDPMPDERRATILREASRLGGEDFLSAVSATLDEAEFQASIEPWRWNPGSSEWSDVLALADLFKSDSSVATYGRFFDQRFVNYLAGNFEEIGQIHWRKFEALIAEYFHRSGFKVELGPGRNDNGVDIRVWEDGRDDGTPPLMIVQCKREQRKISKVVVKALAADVQWENAQQGLLVATTEWSPGARETVRTRSYPVREVNTDALRTWLSEMRTPDKGMWLAG